jgi:hypothetical protein
MERTLIFRVVIINLLWLLYTIPVTAQFNEKLEKEILEIAENYQLDGIEKIDALDRLVEISPDIDRASFRINLMGKSWQYSHSVDAVGRKYRRSNAVYMYDFSANGDAFFISKKGGSKTWCSWDDETSKLLEMDRFESSERKTRTRRDFLGVHSISSDRLVLTKVIKSKDHPEKSAILFNVYFRK